ncbi:MAG: secondary thiamine-phosphate synthase enzyme YjbQ [Candidatus Hydrothermarchaeota archaeon]
MIIETTSFTIKTKGPGDVIDLTSKIGEIVRESKVKNGIVHIFAPHATAVFVLTELESRLKDDIKNFLEALVPEGRWKHTGNAHSHLRSMLLAPDKTLPVRNGKIVIGTWQSLFFIEADTHGRSRRIEVTVMGD